VAFYAAGSDLSLSSCVSGNRYDYVRLFTVICRLGDDWTDREIAPVGAVSRRVPRRRLELPRPDGHWILNIARARRQMKTRIRSVSGETTFVVTFPYFSNTISLTPLLHVQLKYSVSW